MAGMDEILQKAQKDITDCHVEAARYLRNKAMLETASASHLYKKAELALKEQEVMLQRARNANRPSILLGAAVTQTEQGTWIASARGVSAEGNSPETAFLAFDELWTQGTDSDE